MQPYKPNWADPRVRRRAEKVLSWASSYILSKQGSNIPIPISALLLQKIFGPTENRLGDLLREKLLTCTSQYYSAEKKLARQYVVNREGYEYILGEMGERDAEKQARTIAYVNASTPANASADVLPVSLEDGIHTHSYVDTSLMDKLRARHQVELETLTFHMKDVSARLWHPLQNLTSSSKQIFWAPYLPFNYDISACAPSVLLQLALKCGVSPLVVSELQKYVDDKDDLRNHVERITGVSRKNVKRLLNSLFNGARLAKNKHCSTYNLLDYDYDAMDVLQRDARVRDFRAQIARCWRQIELKLKEQKPYDSVSFKTSKQKWHLYFNLERRVLDSIIRFLTDRIVLHFTEHDGFRTNREISIEELEAAILKDTGFSLKVLQD